MRDQRGELTQAEERDVSGWEAATVNWLMSNRYWALLLGLLLSFALAAGGRYLYLETDYRTFFDRTDPQRLAHELNQETYTRNDNLIILLHNHEGSVYQPQVLEVVERITDEAWQMPYAVRVDSLTNYQYS